MSQGCEWESSGSLSCGSGWDPGPWLWLGTLGRGGKGARGWRSISKHGACDLTSLFLTRQESTGLTPTRAVLGMPSGCSATLQQEGRLVLHLGMTSHRYELIGPQSATLAHPDPSFLFV